MKFVSKRAFKRIAIGLGLLIGSALVVNGFFAWQAQRRFDSIIAQIKAAGEPASLAGLAPKPIPPEKNAAAIIDRIAPQFQEFEKQRNALYESPLGAHLDANDEDVQPATPEQLAAMRKILDAFPDFLPALKQAVESGQYASLMDFNVSPNQFIKNLIERPMPRSLATFVRWKIQTLAAEGKPDEAVQLGIEMLKFCRLYDQEPLLVCFLISGALREVAEGPINDTLQQHNIGPKVRAELEKQLALEENRQPFLSALQSERAFGISMTEEQAGRVPAMFRWPMMNGFFLKELESENALYAVAKLPVEEAVVQLDLVGKQPTQQAKAGGKSLIEPAILAAYNARVRRLVYARCLRVLNALGEYRQRNGKDADSIDQLGLPKEATTDPWSGKPLRLKKVDNGWVIYSVGQNNIDDGGDFKDLKDEGIAPSLGYSNK